MTLSGKEKYFALLPHIKLLLVLWSNRSTVGAHSCTKEILFHEFDPPLFLSVAIVCVFERGGEAVRSSGPTGPGLQVLTGLTVQENQDLGKRILEEIPGRRETSSRRKKGWQQLSLNKQFTKDL